MIAAPTIGTRFYKIAEKLTGLGVAIVPTYPGEHGARFTDWTNQATTRMSTVDEWMTQGYPLASGLHIVTPDHNWVCIAQTSGVGCLDIDDPAACLAMGMPALPEDVFTVDTPGKGLHLPFVHNDETRALGNVRNIFKDGEAIFELKGHKAAWCAPWQQRNKDGGWYKPRDGGRPLMLGLSADLIAWIVAHSKAPALKQEAVKWEFHDDEVLANFLKHNKTTEDKSYSEDGSLWVVPEECPLCGKRSSSTGKAGKCKFIFGGKSYGFVCHACGIRGREEFEQAMQQADPGWEPWTGELYADVPVESTEKFPFESPGDALLKVFPNAKETTPEELTEVLQRLPDATARENVQKAWKVAAQELVEIRKGEEIYRDENGKEKTRKKHRHIIDDEILTYIRRTMREVMKASYFVDAYPHIFLPLESSLYKFHNSEDAFRILSRFGLRLTQHDYNLAEENLHHEILMYGVKTHIEKFGCMRGNAIYVNNGRSGIIKITTNAFEEVPNGTDNVYMLNKHLLRWPKLDKQRLDAIAQQLKGRGGKILDSSKLCQHLNALFEEGKLDGSQYQQLVILRYLSLFLGLAIDLRPIMMTLGVQNSGKSTLWEKFMWLFYGVKYESGGLPTNLRSFIAAVTNHQIQLFDNIDSAPFENTKTDYPAYIDLMCKCSSGGKLSIAQLYENNVEKDFELRCDLFLTSRTNPFPSHRSDLLRRMQIFPVRMPSKEEYKTTESMKRALAADTDEIKLETLVRLQLILRALVANDKEWPPVSQMHSYETFTMRIADYEGWREEMVEIWQGYYGEYQERLTEDSPLISFVRRWLGKEGNVGRKVRTSQMYRELEDAYERAFTQNWRTDAVFGRRLKENFSALGLLGIQKMSLNGGTIYWFEPNAEQVVVCKNAYTDSLTRYARELREVAAPEDVM